MDRTRAQTRAERARKRYAAAVFVFMEACAHGDDDQLARARRLLFRRRLIAHIRNYQGGTTP